MSSEQRAAKYTPECPFCGRVIARPAITMTEFGEILSGSCGCGAFYVCDPTGHNMGEAYSEALALMRGSWDIAQLDSGMDYELVDQDYDLRTHTRVYAAGLSGSSGKLVFVKSKQENPSGDDPDKPKSEGKMSQPELKRKVRGLLEAGAYDELAALVRREKAIIRWLISLSYDKEDLISWRAVEAFGAVCRALSGERTGVIRDTIRRLLWSMGDESGGIGWSAAEILGEIIRSAPDEFSDIIPILWSFREEEMFRAGVVRAMGRIGAVRPDLVSFTLNELQFMLDDGNPSVRIHAATALGILEGERAAGSVRKLLADDSEIYFYQDGKLIKARVSELAKEMLSKGLDR